MGNGMNKYSRCDYYKRRRKPDGGERSANFSKEYCEYWHVDKKKKSIDNFERNEFSFASNQAYSDESPLRNSRKPSTFVSSFNDGSKNFK